MAKPGLDGHDRGAKIIARALRDAGMEVIYTGLHQTPEQIVATVLQEDADAVGPVDPLGRAHDAGAAGSWTCCASRRRTTWSSRWGDDSRRRHPRAEALGVAEVFTPGASTQEIIDFIRGAVARLTAQSP